MNDNNNHNGFILTEVIMSFSLIIILSFTVIPIFYQIATEQINLFYKRDIHSYLHDQLITRSLDDAAPSYETITVKQTKVNIQYTLETPYWKGCADWIDAKRKKEKICLFYYPSD